MKALVLAAGIGTRLLPYTRNLPKPLFPFDGRPVLDCIVRSLIRAGVESVVVNTHHLAEQIDTYFKKKHYPVPIRISPEPVILGTGGAMAQNAHHLQGAPFFAVNGDILTDIDLRSVYTFHVANRCPVTLVLTDDPEFNSVRVDAGGRVLGFEDPSPQALSENTVQLTFTGIQVVDSAVLEDFPKSGFSNSIDTYRRMVQEGRPIAACIQTGVYWKDIGTPERYRDASLDVLAAKAFSGIPPRRPKVLKTVSKTPLQGDGSDRTWFRLFDGKKTAVAVDHGMGDASRSKTMASWIYIGRFLKRRKIPVPTVFAYDFFSGWTVMQDLGDLSLQEFLFRTPDLRRRKRMYEKIISRLIDFSIRGIRGFDLARTEQTPVYNAALIEERECRYFFNAFVKGYLGWDPPPEAFHKEFADLSRGTMTHGVWGLMHRDFQSRNIMIRNGRIYFIDFQGARLGPIQYDLASLLIDPYTDLPRDFQDALLEFALRRLSEQRTVDPENFRKGYRYCAVCRNLQMLGAFAHLSRVKGKAAFETYIPRAAASLPERLEALSESRFPALAALARGIALEMRF